MLQDRDTRFTGELIVIMQHSTWGAWLPIVYSRSPPASGSYHQHGTRRTRILKIGQLDDALATLKREYTNSENRITGAKLEARHRSTSGCTLWGQALD